MATMKWVFFYLVVEGAMYVSTGKEMETYVNA